MPLMQPETDRGPSLTASPFEPALSQPQRYESRALAKGMQILERLAESSQPMSLAQISRRIQLGKASTLRLLRTLGALGYLERENGEAYRAHSDWVSLHQQRNAQALRGLALPVLADLATEVEESVALGVLGRDEIRVIESLDGPQPDRVSQRNGRLMAPHASALGKAIAAFQSPERIQALLHAYGVFALTPATLVSADAIEAELAAVRQSGYARDREESAAGEYCFAAPIRDAGGQVTAAVSVSLAAHRLTSRVEVLVPDAVQRAAGRISDAVQGRSTNTRGAATT